MLETSPLYKVAVAKGNRSSQARIYFGVYDVTAREDATPTTNGTQPFTSINAIKGEIREPEYKVGTFEDDYFRLDGSTYLMPDDINPNNDIIGWWSSSMSDAGGIFASTIPTVTITFTSPHSSLGIGLSFGSEEYCNDFEVTWYNGANIIGSETVLGNTERDCSVNKPIENYNKIIIRFLKTRNPYRYVKLMEVSFGVDTNFDNNDLVSARIIEDIDPSSASLSINTLKFSVINKDQKFNMLNPDGVYSYLQRRQKIVARSGLRMDNGEYEYINMGTFYLSDWKNSTGLTATLEATDALGLLDRTEYKASPFWVNEPVENVIRHILNDAGQFSLIISNASALERINGYIPPKSHRDALKDVLIASRSVLRLTRTGIFEVLKADYSVVAEVGNDLIIGSPSIEQKQLITGVEAKEVAYTLASTASELNKSTFTLTGTQKVVIYYGKAAASVSVAVTGAGTIIGSPKYSAVAVELTINGTGSLTVTVTGKEYVEAIRSVTASIPALPAGEIPQTLTLEENKLLVGNGLAVATNILNYHQKRIKQKFGYWDNPAIQAGDCIDVETMFGQSFSGIVEHQEITFAPKLVATLEVTG